MLKVPQPRLGFQDDQVNIKDLLDIHNLVRKWKGKFSRLKGQPNGMTNHSSCLEYPKMIHLDSAKLENAPLITFFGGKNLNLSCTLLVNAILVSNCDTATHFAAQLVEYVVLNADKIQYINLIKGIRAVALSWGHGTKGYEETLTILNMVKEEAFNYSLTAARAWILVKSLLHTGKHVTHELISFMENLENNGIIHYTIFINEHEPTEKLIAGKFKILNTIY